MKRTSRDRNRRRDGVTENTSHFEALMAATEKSKMRRTTQSPMCSKTRRCRASRGEIPSMMTTMTEAMTRRRVVVCATIAAAALSSYGVSGESISLSSTAYEKSGGDASPSTSTSTYSPSANNPPPSPHIGDKMRSTSSASSFFRSIDRDGDGTLNKPEVASFVRDYVGGSAFDTADEVEVEVGSVMEMLDRDRDNGLDRSDVYEYWNQLESLLTADEVADWVVYAVQLPEYVGRIFKENVVTGYDFPELVENDGEALMTDLKIEKSSFRKKIIRHVNARMLGIGTVPSTPENVKHDLEGCSAVAFQWNKSTARGFPVHSYRFQRRAVLLKNTVSSTSKSEDAGNSSHPSAGEGVAKESSCSSGAVLDPKSNLPVVSKCATDQASLVQDSSPSSIPSTEWETVYSGGDNEYVDTDLENDRDYVYRIQAWNSVGRSDWVTIHVSGSPLQQKCSSRTDNPNPPPNDTNTPSSSSSSPTNTDTLIDWPSWTSKPRILLSGSFFVANFVITFIRGIFAIAALTATVMKMKRASATTTTSTDMRPAFPWFWKEMNSISVRLLGVEIVPKSILGDARSLELQTTQHDESVKAVGLDGYKRTRTFHGARNDVVNKVPSKDVFRRRNSLPTSFTPMLGVSEVASTDSKIDNPSPLKSNNRRTRRLSISMDDSVHNDKLDHKINDSHAHQQLQPQPQPQQQQQQPPKLFRTLKRGVSARTLSTNDSNISTCGSCDDDSGDSCVSQTDFEDDPSRCNTCRKRYKFPKRWKHHCSRCLATFCHKHGSTSHSNLVSCKVPGDCVCDVCLELDELIGRNPRRRPSEKGWSLNLAPAAAAAAK